jgi:hypothetical protein
MSKRILFIFTVCFFVISFPSFAQSPEISLREFASGQIKKGVGSIGKGGDGATWGNYSLVWRDTCTALLDGGVSAYPNNNSFSFTAVGATTPALWHGLAVYVISLSQYAPNIGLSLKSPGLGTSSIPVHGDGSNQSIFVKSAMPLGKGFSFGILLAYERSQFDAVADNDSSNYVRYHTNWLPSGGFGITWQPVNRVLVGFRALFNNDNEIRIDKKGTSTGLNSSQEYRSGISVGLWKGSLIDVGGNVRLRYNQINNTRQTNTEPNIGFEQNLWERHFAFRMGLDESSKTAGISLRFHPIVIDIAYVRDLGLARLGNLFGTNSNSLLVTLVFDYGASGVKK